jgi:hypothetical protein
MTGNQFVTGVQVFVVGAEGPGGTVITSDLNIAHAVPAAELGTDRPRAVCGLFMDDVLSDVPFPPAETLAMPRAACAECLRVVTTES